MRFRSLAAAAVAASLPLTGNAQLFISEFLANTPGSTDSPFEWVELVATENIDFSVTPYSVVFSDNSSSRFGTNGWSTGLGATYGFEITSGVVSRGDVVYVGGSSMSPTGTKLRIINTANTAGDGFGNSNSGGVLGNGGSVPDGIAVFSSAISSVTDSLRPIDAILFGTAGSMNLLSAYELPVNDNYNGGKVSSTSFLAPDPGSSQTILATGTYNVDTRAWEVGRTWTLGTMSDGLSSVTLTAVPEPSTTALVLLGGVFAAGLMARRKQ